MKVLIPKVFLSETEFYKLKNCYRENLFEDIEKDLTPAEADLNKKIFLKIHNGYNGLTFFLRVRMSGHDYSFSIGKFGLLKTYDEPIVTIKNYQKALKIWQDEIIPEIYPSVYNIIGIKQKDYQAEFVTKDFVAKLIEVV